MKVPLGKVVATRHDGSKIEGWVSETPWTDDEAEWTIVTDARSGNTHLVRLDEIEEAAAKREP